MRLFEQTAQKNFAEVAEWFDAAKCFAFCLAHHVGFEPSRASERSERVEGLAYAQVSEVVRRARWRLLAHHEPVCRTILSEPEGRVEGLNRFVLAEVAELAYALVSEASPERVESSNLSFRTNLFSAQCLY